MVLNTTETIMLIRDQEKRGKGIRRCGEDRLYTYRYTVTTRMTLALRWAAMRAILVFHLVWRTVTRQCPQTTTFEEKREPKWIQTEVPPLCLPA